jgi:large subunit ribosomal protein L17
LIKAFARRKLSRTSSHRAALLRNLASAIIMNESISTTLPKAKEAQSFVEKLITLAKAGKQSSFLRIRRDIDDKKTIDKLFDVIALRYKERQGGYTRIFRIGVRKGDNAMMAVLKLIQ